MKIFLIGMPGSGKTTVGAELSQQLGIAFVDLDHVIEESEGLTIGELFSLRGEEGFRDSEKVALQAWLNVPTDFVMATGGGAPCFHDNMDKMLAAGITVFLDPPVEELAARLQEEGTNVRPLLRNAGNLAGRLQQLRNDRLECYQRASLRVTGPDHTEEILRHLSLSK